MSKTEQMDQLEDTREALFNMIDELRDTLDLEDLDIETIKEWGRSLLIAGVAAFVIYKVIRGIAGGRNVQLEDDSAVLKGIKVKDDGVISRFVKEQVVIILLSLVRKWIKRYLKAKALVDED
jgi:hypothetical protein